MGDQMARTPLTEEEKQALRERLAKARDAKKQKQASKEEEPQKQTQSSEPTVSISQEQLDALLTKVSLLEKAVAHQVTPTQAIDAKAEMQGISFGKNGIQGVVYKYPIEQDYYPDPSNRILNMPELARYAPHENYELKWEVSGVEYEKANITYSEPRFTVTFLRKMYDDYGNITSQRAILGRHIQHEDENVVRMVARDMGLDTSDERTLLDEVRFQRIRRWVLDLFTPYRQEDRTDAMTEMVIDGKIVPVMEITTNADKSIPVSISPDTLKR
jgi:hypothetical protein